MKEHRNSKPKSLTRRQFLLAGLGVAGTAVLAMYGVKLGKGGTGQGTTSPVSNTAESTPPASVLEPTPQCGTDPTPEQTEGPYFTPNSPERTSLLEQDMVGTKLSITGFVMTAGCQPVSNALLDFWQANADGEYDNAGYSLRGHQYTDEQGKFTLHTIVPGLYPGRTRHIHVKVQAPNATILTTQLYFPNEPRNDEDRIFNDKLIMSIRENGDGSQSASFNFVV